MCSSSRAGACPWRHRFVPAPGWLLVAAAFATATNARAQPTGTPIPFKLFAKDLDGLRPWSDIHAELEQLADVFPEVTRLLEIGESAEGRPLLALRIANDPDDLARPSIMLVAGHHANEAGAPEHVVDAARTLLAKRFEEPYVTWLAHVALVVVPMVNPDGSHAFWEIDYRLGRKNRRRMSDEQNNIGVDLNRNYPFYFDGPETRFSSRDPESNFYRGPSWASEPEVQAMVELAQRERPVGMISYHSAAARLLVPYAVPGAKNPDPSSAWAVAQHMLDRLPHTFGKRQFRAIGALYPVTGVEKDWYHHSFGTAAYLVELPYRRPRGARLVESIEHTRGAWMALFERWLEGPSLSVRAVDSSGAPIEASVQLDQIATRAGERWTTDPDNGWFHYYLPAAGTYTVRLGTEALEVSRDVVVGSGWTRIEIPMVPSVTLLAQAGQ